MTAIAIDMGIEDFDRWAGDGIGIRRAAQATDQAVRPQERRAEAQLGRADRDLVFAPVRPSVRPPLVSFDYRLERLLVRPAQDRQHKVVGDAP